MEEGSSSEFPDCANLPQEIVHLISEKVKSIVDYVRFRAVCSSWWSASLPKPRHLPPQLPWLLIAHVPQNCQSEEDKETRLFYDLWQSKMHKFRLPEISCMNCYACYRGWVMLVSSNGSQVLVMNPLTRTRIQLPSFTAVKHIPDDFGDLYWYSPQKVTFSADPTDPNCLIMVIISGFWGAFYCLFGDPCWTWVTEFPEISAPLVDITYYRRRFYLLFYEGGLEIVEANKPEEKIICEFEPELGVDFKPKFLLEGNSEVYVVAALPAAQAHDTEDGTEKSLEPKIRLYQFQEQPLKLKQLTDTSNTVIFTGASWLTVCPDDWDSLDGRSLYKVECSVKLQKEYLKVCYTIYFCKLMMATISQWRVTLVRSYEWRGLHHCVTLVMSYEYEWMGLHQLCGFSQVLFRL